MKVYIVFEGDYSETHVVKVFDSMEKAQAFIDKQYEEDWNDFIKLSKDRPDYFISDKVRLYERPHEKDPGSYVDVKHSEMTFDQYRNKYDTNKFDIEDYEVH